MQRPRFVTGNIYHVYNRGVEKRKIFLHDKDYLRFIHDLFEFNDGNPTLNLGRFLSTQLIDVRLQSIERGPRKLLVEVLAFCLMPNHYHLLLRQKVEKGITEFMRKLGTGYTNYFNQKYERVGALFQGKFKAVVLNKDAHLIHLPYYIHLNPVELIISKWRSREVRLPYVKIMKFLENYRWSSYLDYIGQKNFPSVTQRKYLQDITGKPTEYKKAIKKYLKDFSLEEIDEVLLEK